LLTTAHAPDDTRVTIKPGIFLGRLFDFLAINSSLQKKAMGMID
jgi:hypothetical protein